MIIRRRWQIEEPFAIELGLNRRSGRGRVRVPAPAGRRRGGEEVTDVVAVDKERVPVDEGIAGVHERRRRVVVEEEDVAAHHYYLHKLLRSPLSLSLSLNLSLTMSDKCGNCDCADKSQCVKKRQQHRFR